MDYNAPGTLSPDQDPMLRMQNAYKNANASQLDSGAVKPVSLFIKPNNATPYNAPEAGGGKFICTKLLESGTISFKEYAALARAHFVALFLDPKFCFWYLKNGHAIVEKNWDLDWSLEGREFIDTLKIHYKDFGYRGGLSFYKQFSFRLAEKAGIPTKDKGNIFLTSWTYKSFFPFIKVQVKSWLY